ncbi:phage O protein family [Escherichia coli]|uniref:Phage O protein family n=1 Tax=Escherichia coli TaxID=562 RepID=A0A2X1P3U0_ECOLX|nr:phage O protein family [Escherichia coli]
MSTKLTGYVWDGCAASGMKLSSVAIMARLADFSNDEGVCWPSIETIARQIGAGMSTVRTAIARLEAEGWLTRKARRQGNDEARISDVKNALARGEIPEQKKIERVLRDVGLSRTQAKAFMAGGYGALSLRDAEDVGSALNALKNLNF